MVGALPLGISWIYTNYQDCEKMDPVMGEDVNFCQVLVISEKAPGMPSVSMFIHRQKPFARTENSSAWQKSSDWEKQPESGPFLSNCRFYEVALWKKETLGIKNGKVRKRVLNHFTSEG